MSGAGARGVGCEGVGWGVWWGGVVVGGWGGGGARVLSNIRAPLSIVSLN